MILKSHFCGQNPVLMPAWFRSHFSVPGRGRRAAAHCTGGHFPTQGSRSVSLPWVIPSGGQRSRGKWLSCHSVATVRSKLELDFPAYENLYFSNRFFQQYFSLCYLYLSLPTLFFVPCCTLAVLVLISKPTYAPLSKLPGCGMFYVCLLAPRLHWDYMMSRFPCSQT